MITRSEKIKAGIFFVIGVVLLTVFLSFLGYLETREEGAVFHSYFTGVENLHKGAAVKYNGVQVGKVTDISIPSPGKPQVRVEYLVEKPKLVTSNTSAQLTYTSYISGTQGISLTPRRSQCPQAQGQKVKNHRIPTCRSDVTMAFETLLDSVERLNSLLERNGPNIDELLVNTNSVLRDVRTLLSGAPRAEKAPPGSLISVAQRLDKLVLNLSHVSKNLDKTLTDAQDVFHRGNKTMGSIESLSQSAQNAIHNNEDELEQAITDFSHACRTLRKASESLQAIMDDNRGTLNATLLNVLHSTQNMEELVRKLRSQPSLIISSPTPRKRNLRQ